MNENEVIEESAEAADEIEETEDVSEEAAETLEEEELENTEDNEDIDDDFEYDEEGNIIIPDDDFEEDSSERDEETLESETAGAPSPKKGKGEKETESEPSGEPSPAQDPRDEEIKRLRAEISKYEKQGRDTLKQLGSDKPEEVLLGLEKLAAESQGISLEEYRANRTAEEQKAQTRALLQNEMFEKKAKEDLNELHLNFPETREYKHVKDLPPEILKKFGDFRDLGLTAKEAYAAANPDGARDYVATAVKKQAMHDSKQHLRSSVPKASRDTSVELTKRQFEGYREMFPGLSDKEIINLYKRATK